MKIIIKADTDDKETDLTLSTLTLSTDELDNYNFTGSLKLTKGNDIKVFITNLLEKEKAQWKKEQIKNLKEKLDKGNFYKQAWQKIGELEWSESLGKMDWYEAEKKCEEMGGRLPTRIELIDLVDNHSEEIKNWDKDYLFWSATTGSNATHLAWSTYLSNGYTDTNSKATSGSYYLRCVR